METPDFDYDFSKYSKENPQGPWNRLIHVDFDYEYLHEQYISPYVRMDDGTFMCKMIILKSSLVSVLSRK